MMNCAFQLPFPWRKVFRSRLAKTNRLQKQSAWNKFMPYKGDLVLPINISFQNVFAKLSHFYK